MTRSDEYLDAIKHIAEDIDIRSSDLALKYILELISEWSSERRIINETRVQETRPKAIAAWLRNVGGEDDCWVPCAKGDPGAVEFFAILHEER